MRNLFLLLALVALEANAQDVIVKKDGSTILSKVTKIGTSEVEYKKFSNQNGPSYSILKSDIQAINYENGEKETFAEALQSISQESQKKQQIIVATPAADNAELISRYNLAHEHGDAIKDKDKRAEAGFCILGVSESSILSSEDVIIEIRQEPYTVSQNNLGYTYDILKRFFIQIYNKTDNIIYIDLGSSFRIMKDGTVKSYFDNTQTTITQARGSGVGMNLGAITDAVGIGGIVGTLANGVSVGSGNTSSSSKVYAKERIISIPPHGKVPLEKYHRVWLNNNNVETISNGEILSFGYKNEELPKLNIGEKYIYNENNSPYYSDYIITYSKDTDFQITKIVKVSVYMRELIGAKPWFGKYWDMSWWKQTKDPQKQITLMTEHIRDYNNYTVVGTFGYASNALEK